MLGFHDKFRVHALVALKGKEKSETLFRICFFLSSIHRVLRL